MGADTCTCIGKNRKFVQTMGSCLCESGFKPKDGKADQDDVSDCESSVKPTCTEGQSVTLIGDCVTNDDDICIKQCNNQTGVSYLECTNILLG